LGHAGLCAKRPIQSAALRKAGVGGSSRP